ncbi:hypothetical protein [Microbulbifer aggregans]|uniref:hypothetical protein n=1 Tax=Microbulbifer aggregans TaxID=1769779 RepID=UPI001CFCB6AA|nr:hypothetical protein [Microbulbifer aggregans]
MNRLLIVTWIILSIGCTQRNDSIEIVVTEVSGSKTDNHKNEFCSDFTISQEAAEEFFRKSELTSLKQLHDEHNYLPCYSYGTASVGSKSCSWEIRAGNTAELKCGDIVKYYACDDCLKPQ